MQLAIQYTPRIYLIWLAICVVGTVVAMPFTDSLIAYDGGTGALAFGFRWISWIAGGIFISFTVVQIAVLGLHSDEVVQLREEKKRLGRLLWCLLPIGFLWQAGEMMPFSARNLQAGYLITSDRFWGILIPATMFTFFGLVTWYIAREKRFI